MKNIYFTLSNELEKDVPLAIATILETKGSTPQVQGASAIFSPEGLIAGTLGGGIMEEEAREKARKAINENVSMLYESDLDAGISEDDTPICGGRVMIIIDAFPRKHFKVFRDISQSYSERRPGALLTTFKKSNNGKTEISRYWIDNNNPDDLSNEPVLSEYKEELQKCLKEKIFYYRESVVSVFIEPVFPSPQLIIVGAGHVGQAVTHIASLLGFEITVIDDRPEFCNKDKCPDADHLVVGDMPEAIHEISKSVDTYIVIVTRGHKYDAEVLRQCIGSDAAYIGMMGSRRKVRLMRKQFLDEGWATSSTFDRVDAPIGIEIGSQTVQEIALSICAQMVSIRNQKSGKKHKPVISAIILAAGESSRMGKAKMLLPWLDRTIIETVIQNIIQSEIKNIIVVLGAEKDKIQYQISNYPVIITENPNYLNGMLSSVQCGLRALPGDTDAVMILLGDQPMISSPVIDQLADTYRHSDKGILIAVHKGKRGHPILFKIKYKKEIEELNVENSLHDFTMKFASDILEVETETSDILRDIDTYEDYNKEIKYRRLL
jgi:xanthine/CO dehydrogenase XdhC/CoxF family maturation factor/CTP:molybdopterin cytidylyltransferase MocA